MYLNNGFKFNRFGEEIDFIKSSNVDVEAIRSEFDKKIATLQTEFSTGAKSEFEKVKDELLSRVEKQVSFKKGYVSVKNKRIVSVSKGLDKNDVIIKEQLDEVNSKVEGLLKGIEVTDDCIKIKNHRRICNISKSKNDFDAINHIEFVENNNHRIEVSNHQAEKFRELSNKCTELERQLSLKIEANKADVREIQEALTRMNRQQ